MPVIGGKSAGKRFEAFIKPHFDALYHTAYRLTGVAADAEDLVQDVCLRAFPRLEELEQMAHPRSWLQRVLYHLFVDGTRRYENTHVRSIDSVDSSCLASDDAGPEDQVDMEIAEQRLLRAWRHMDRAQRALLALHDVEGFTLKELEAMTGVRQGTLKSRLHRGRVRLGKLLQRETSPVALVSGLKG